ncbi:phospholipase D-like domain-containing protein [Salarchaeum sp. JOR-1]|uniref:phospholipase D-like domain-containing protein n=1 Tax=Salarchaeum sp. JOR-1 TaxID=2599399 RepID=UPI001198732D|nr:phospholipase D-like domain-containing protein [Salarchaeum sp. JOR-1]QDX41314.1 phospholipase [Salarchaeum sp. JOR-1]
MFRALALALVLSMSFAGVVPNPVTDGDRGEYVTLSVPENTSLGAYTLSDGEDTVGLPNETVSGRIALAGDPALARNLTDARPVRVPGFPRLANGGETLVLRRNGTVVDRLTYERAPESEVFADGGWRPLGATDFATASASDVPVSAFALPDAPERVLAALRGAEKRVLLAGYTFSAPRIARVLAAAANRGVPVRVLVEGGPVGGVTEKSARVLDRLVTADVAVRVLDGPRSRYAYHHAKYAVVDDRALVTSENWKPGGVGGHATRGWGVVLRDPGLADRLAVVHRADSTWRDGIPWREYRANATFQDGSPATATYRSDFPAWNGTADASVFVTPEDGHDTTLDVLRAATGRLLVQQVRIDDDRFLNATLDAARRGVRTRVLLGGAWYVREENRALVERLRKTARAEGLPLRARVVDPRSRFDHLHVKGVVTENAVLVGSLNWNHESVVENREVMVVLRGERIAAYYADVFRSDWRGGVWRLPLGALSGVVVVVLGAARVVWRRVSFTGSGRSGVPRRVPRPPSSR